jgi:uncharacterized protein with von Willebrand factor type A (vWA) domain
MRPPLQARVIGAGPTGSLAALALAEAGWTVSLEDPLSPAALTARQRAYAFTHSSRRLLERLGQASAEAQAEAQALGAARDLLQRQARALVEQRFDLFGRPATENFMTEVAVRRPLGRMGPPDIDRMKIAVARMAKRLAAKHSQRRRIRLHGQLDFRRTLRANAGLDGVPVNLSFKHKRRDKPRLVVICDVSASVAAHVRFLLLFL